MNSPEFGKYDLQPNDEELDLDAEYTDDYHIEHATEISEMLLSMKDEATRKPEMEKDATSKAGKIHEEIIFHKGKKYQKMLSGLKSILESDDVTIENPKKFDLCDKKIPIDWFILYYTKFSHISEEAICRVVSDGIFDILGLAEDKRPPLKLIEIINKREPESTSANKDTKALAYFHDPESRRNRIPAEKGDIVINLPNFNGEPSILDIMATLEHECFHVYQFNRRHGNVPMETVRDRIMMSAYHNGRDQYIDGNNDFEGYYEQGYESSARVFADQLTHATEELFREAISQTIKGDANG